MVFQRFLVAGEKPESVSAVTEPWSELLETPILVWLWGKEVGVREEVLGRGHGQSLHQQGKQIGERQHTPCRKPMQSGVGGRGGCHQ